MTQNIFSVWYLDAIVINIFYHVCVRVPVRVCVMCNSLLYEAIKLN